MNLRQLPNAVVRTVVEFRGNLKDNMERANAGFPVVITKNDAVESVLVSPEIAQRLFKEPVEPPKLNEDAIDTEELVTEYEVELDEDEVVAPPTMTAEAVGIESVPPIINESPSVDDDVVPTAPSTEEASAEVADATPADASEDELDPCPACMGVGENHEVPSIEHPTEASLEPTDEVVTEVEVSTPEEAAEPTPAETPAVEEVTPITCEVNVVASVDCVSDAVSVVNFSGKTFSICQYHLDQLAKSGKEYEVVNPESSV